MASSRAREASSTNSSPSRNCYHVFLSFSGEDTRKTFTDNLYTAFVDKGFPTFRDEEELERGEDIKPKFEIAIQQSRSSVIVFSKNYAFSRWCLDKLVMILERKRISDHVVLPVFYDVDPSDVRKQTGSVEEAFAKHEKNGQPSNKMNQWKKALAEVADLAGMVRANQADGYESKFIKKIIKVIDDKLSRIRTPFTGASYLIGIDSRVQNINSWLNDGSTDVGIVLVNGIGRIGKTTIAKFVYNLNHRRFEGSCFLEDVRETSKKPNGLVQLQSKFLRDILSGRKVKVHSVSEGINKIRDAIICKRVLLVLDDVDDMDQIRAIFGRRDWFFPGSKIIITTRYAQLLRERELSIYNIYNVHSLNVDESLELFNLHAFGQDQPREGYLKLSKRIADRSGGLPLALQTLGSSLYGRDMDVWESTLDKLVDIPQNEVFKKLRISYDALQDNHDQNLFLHIACFFVGKEKDYIVRILDGCDFFTIVGIENLVDRCLVTIGEDKVKRSRLWRDKDSFDVLKSKNIPLKVLKLNMHVLSASTLSGNSNEIVLHTNAFARMNKLRLLQLSHVQFKGSYKELPKELRWLSWLGFPLKSIASDFPLEFLVYLEMHQSNLTQVFNRKTDLRQVLKGRKTLFVFFFFPHHLPSLKTLDLSHSHSLTEIGNFSLVPNLERLILEDCLSLVDIHDSIGKLNRLVYLNLKDCIKIMKLPRNVFALKLLDTLIVSGCLNLDAFPAELKMMESLKVLDVADISVTTTGEVKSRLRRNPETFWASLPRCLAHLKLTSCNLSDDSFPKDFSNLPFLALLDLSNNLISGLPDCVRGLKGLDQLIFSNCKMLKELAELPRVTYLGVFDCTLLEKVTFQSSSCIPFEFLCFYNPNLVEIEYTYKFEPIERFDMELIHLLGLYNLDPTATIQMIFPCRSAGLPRILKLEDWIRVYPIQGLYEYGIFSTFLPGNVVPGQFSHRSRGSSISFTVPSTSNQRVRGLNTFSVYTRFDGGFRPGYHCDIISPIITKVSNKSTGVKFIYDPSCFGDPGHSEEDVIFLSHWDLENQLKGGDELKVSIFMRAWFELKECGIQLVYEKEKKMITQQDTTTPSFASVSFERLEYELMPRTYFLSHGPVTRRTLRFRMWRNSVLFNDIFMDSDQEADREVLQQGELRLATTQRHPPHLKHVIFENRCVHNHLFGSVRSWSISPL
ncbi:unnamed protein product [Malus baccata var. baccata]